MKRYTCLTVLILFISFTSLFSRKIFFAYQSTQNVKSVAVIGTFNNWSATATVMKRAFDNIWTVQVEIPDGTYLYNFLVDGHVVADPHNPKKKPNGKGGYYSVLTVGTFTPPTGIKGDGIIHKNYIQFDEYSRVYVNPASTNTIYFAIDTLKNDVQSINIKVGRKLYPMVPIEINKYTNRYKMILHPSTEKFHYKFIIEDGKTKLELGKSGLATTSKAFIFNFASPTVSILDAPRWAKGAIIYEIFPDRFFDGDVSNDPIYTTPWGEKPAYNNFFGGDLQGIIDKLRYLKDLGVDILYTTPIFEAQSNHKYDTQDYMRIDPHFGTMQTFRTLANLLHSNNMYWVIDGVFNHTGTDFFAFRDVIKNQQNSKYVHWYFIKHFPVRVESGDYATFQNYPSLPKLNVRNLSVQEYLKKVVNKWTSNGADGWRIDSANVIANAFLVKLYKWIHEIKPDSLDVSEIWTNASDWFNEGAFNSTMNYLFKDAAYSYIVYGAGARAFLNDTNSYLNTYPPQLWNALWNLIDSHDTPRAFTAVDGSIQKMKVLVGLQMTFIGAPMIYYGDEIGMSGGNDPLNRGCMNWKRYQWNSEIYEWYKKLIRIRRDTLAIRYGNYTPIVAKKQVFGFKRNYENQEVYVFINGGENVQDVKTPLVGSFRNLIDGSIWSYQKPITLELQPYEVLILERK